VIRQRVDSTSSSGVQQATEGNVEEASAQRPVETAMDSMNSKDRTIGASRRGLLASAGVALCLALLPRRMAAAEMRPAIGHWGFDVGGMDPTVRPGDDFFRYGGGSWLKNTEIPPDRATWGPFFALRAKAEADVKAILDDLIRRRHEPGSAEQKIADFYTAYLDTAAIEMAGLRPIQASLAAIAQAGSHEEIARLMVRVDLGVGGPFSINPSRSTSGPTTRTPTGIPSTSARPAWACRAATTI
jgi:hypothetical protein